MLFQSSVVSVKCRFDQVSFDQLWGYDYHMAAHSQSRVVHYHSTVAHHQSSVIHHHARVVHCHTKVVYRHSC